MSRGLRHGKRMMPGSARHAGDLSLDARPSREFEAALSDGPGVGNRRDVGDNGAGIGERRARRETVLYNRGAVSQGGSGRVYILELGGKMGGKAIAALYVALMIAIVFSVDILFFRNQFWERLMVNSGIVLVLVAFYLRFFGRP